MTASRSLPRRTVLASMAAAPLTWLVGCGGSGGDAGDGTVRLVNASRGYSTVDLYLDGVIESSGVAYGSAGGYEAAAAGSHTMAVAQSGVATPLISQSHVVTKDVPMTLLFYGSPGATGMYVVTDNQTAPAAGQASLLIRHGALNAGSVDIYLSGATDALANATLLAQGVAVNTTAAGNTYVPVTAGSYRLRVTVAGDTTTVLLDTGASSLITFASTQVATLLLTDSQGGNLVDALLVTQGGAVQTFANTQALVRLVSALPGGTVVSGSIGSNAVSSSSPAIGAYGLVDAGTLQPSITVGSVAMNIASRAIVAGSNTTLLIWGAAASPSFSWIDDDNRAPAIAGDAKLRLLNGLTDSTAPTTLTANFSVVASNVAQGTASPYGLLAATALTELGVSATQGTVYETPVSSLPTLVAGRIYTLFLFGPVAAPQALLRVEH